MQSIQGDRYIAANWYSAVIPLIEQADQSPVPVDSYEVAVAMLRRGRANGVVVPEPMTATMTDLLDGLVSEPYVDAEAGLYVSRSAPELLEAFNVANAKCRGDFWKTLP